MTQSKLVANLPATLLARTAILALLAAGLGRAPAMAAQADPAAGRVESLCNGVLEAVKQARTGGAQARAKKIQPVVDDSFNLGIMAQFAVGPAWAKMSAGDHAGVTAAMSRYTAARYAQEFEGFTGQKCVVDPAVQTRGPDKLVKSKIVEASDSSPVNYRLREYGGAWKVIDIYYTGVSQLATQRADFASVLQSSGAAGLTAKLNELAAKAR